MKNEVIDLFKTEFGPPSREVVKAKSWDLRNDVGVVVQMDGPTRENAAYVWLPYPGDGQRVPEIAIEYPGEAGRHSGTYPAAGLKRGEPALKLTIRSSRELDDVVAYIRAMATNANLPDVKETTEPAPKHAHDVFDSHGATTTAPLIATQNSSDINAVFRSQSPPLPRDISAKCGGWRHEKRFKISCLREPY
jgi:hypothetical protein